MNTLRKCWLALSATEDWKVDALVCAGFAVICVDVGVLFMAIGGGR